MKRPAVVDQVTFPLAFSAIGFIGAGASALFVSATTSTTKAGLILICGIAALFFGLLIGVVTIQFRKLRPWTYPIVRILCHRWLGLKGAAGLDRKLAEPEVMDAFGLKSSAGSKPESQDKSGQ